MKVKAVLFDFDGTLSTLRDGWEQVMRPMMVELAHITDAEAAEYIDQSTGIQTIFQMEWLSKRMENPADPWALKEEYLRRLMTTVNQRREDISKGKVSPIQYHIKGADDFLAGLHSRGVKLYAASGTDDADVKYEAELLGFSKYFEAIRGAGERSRACGKEAVIGELTASLDPASLAVIGDGKVEIELGHRIGARTIGIANSETQNRLTQAGADMLVGDFSDLERIYAFLGL